MLSPRLQQDSRAAERVLLEHIALAYRAGVAARVLDSRAPVTKAVLLALVAWAAQAWSRLEATLAPPGVWPQPPSLPLGGPLLPKLRMPQQPQQAQAQQLPQPQRAQPEWQHPQPPASPLVSPSHPPQPQRATAAASPPAVTAALQPQRPSAVLHERLALSPALLAAPLLPVLCELVDRFGDMACQLGLPSELRFAPTTLCLASTWMLQLPQQEQALLSLDVPDTFLVLAAVACEQHLCT